MSTKHNDGVKYILGVITAYKDVFQAHAFL